MSVDLKIVKAAGQKASQLEITIAQAMVDLENSAPELKKDLRPLQFCAAKEKQFNKVQIRLTRELEKKFSDRHVLFVAQRRILPKVSRKQSTKQPRPRSRTLTAVHDAILEDLAYPTEIIGKRIKHKVDGSRLIKVFLDTKDTTSQEHKLDTFGSIYKKLTGKDAVFEFPVHSHMELI
ncbi:ribosomal protein S7A [Entomophthora muscae]|uniref:Ribosomal protein S7A n=1 Tax=Entomophthora muscae TaxID=34485 RepID=A0ACC2RNR3_9FUNG|nr:ribosomal protein S7A [Entomophthora muscae]